MSGWRNWVMDATLYHDDGMFCFCPVEDDGTLIVGMNFLGEKPPGKLTGIVHLDGQEAVERWIEDIPLKWSGYEK